MKESARGVLLSVKNGITELAPVKKHFDFAVFMGTQGDVLVDPVFEKNWKEAGKLGLVRGVCHHFVADAEAYKQIRLFLKTVGRLGEKDLPPVIYLETNEYFPCEDLSAGSFAYNLINFLEHLEYKTRRIPVLFTSTPFIENHFMDPFFLRYPLWQEDHSELPPLWEQVGRIFASGKKRHQCEGAQHHVTTVDFSGNKEELQSFISNSLLESQGSFTKTHEVFHAHFPELLFNEKYTQGYPVLSHIYPDVHH